MIDRRTFLGSAAAASALAAAGAPVIAASPLPPYVASILMKSILRSDDRACGPTERAALYRALSFDGRWTVNAIRAIEDMPPIAGGDC